MSVELPSALSLARYRDLLVAALGTEVSLTLVTTDGIIAAEPTPGVAIDVQWKTLPRPGFGEPADSIAIESGGETLRQAIRIEIPASDADCALIAAAHGAVDAASRLAASLAHVADLLSDAWRTHVELDDMAQELAERYEELNLAYDLEVDVGTRAGTAEAVEGLLDELMTRLSTDVAAVNVPTEELRCTRFGDTRDDLTLDVESRDELLERAARMADAADGSIVINTPHDPRRARLSGTDRKLLAIRIGVRSGREPAVLMLLREPHRPDFTNGDRKLVERIAEQITASLRAGRDGVTGLLNRTGFERRLATFVADRRGTHGKGVLAVLSLRQFKVLNDTCGHTAGDELLRVVASAIDARTREDDGVARLEGDTFSVLLRHCDATSGTAAIEKLLGALGSIPFVWDGKPFPVAVNAGLVPLAPYDTAVDVSELLEWADTASRMATRAGPGRLHVYSANDDELREERGHMQWVPRIREALDSDRFVLYAQPIVATDPTARHAHPHHEILLRLREADGSILSPFAFMPAAERFRLMPDIDRWVVSRTFRRIAEASPPVRTDSVWAVNVSGQTLSDDTFLAYVLAEFERHQIPFERICLEITETAAVSNHAAALELINALRARGVKFSLDDFGTGLSSFAYLQNLPVDYLKIDGSFVRNVLEDRVSSAMVTAVNQVGQVLGLRTVAEFVENEKVLAVLRVIGVDFAQGYGTGKPAPIEDAIASASGLGDLATSVERALRLAGDA